MRILLIHSDYLNYNVKNKTPVAEEIEDAKKQGAFDESLVVFTAVEKDDENNPQGIVKNLVKEVIKTNDQVKAENIVLYPYAHLSSSLSSPKVAVQVLKDAEEALNAEGLNVKRVPFGWYKAFEISCKGHPLSELSRTITAEERKNLLHGLFLTEIKLLILMISNLKMISWKNLLAMNLVLVHLMQESLLMLN